MIRNVLHRISDAASMVDDPGTEDNPQNQDNQCLQPYWNLMGHFCGQSEIWSN